MWKKPFPILKQEKLTQKQGIQALLESYSLLFLNIQVSQIQVVIINVVLKFLGLSLYSSYI